MSAEIETYGDKAAFYSARLDPWHRLGTVTKEAKNAEEALHLAYLDYEVTKVPLTMEVDGRHIEVPGKFATKRNNPFTGEPEALGVVGNKYRVVQNMDNCTFLDEVVGRTGGTFETAGALYNGREVFVSMKAPKGLMIGGHDAVDLYMLATNRHDGLAPFTIAATPIRVVCKNTERAAMKKALRMYKIQHSGNIESKVTEAQEALGVMWNYIDEFEGWAESMYRQEFDDAAFRDFVEHHVFPEPDVEESDLVRGRRLARQDSILDLWQYSPTLEGIHGTKWGAYNAITEYTDWLMPIRNENKRALRTVSDPTLDKFVRDMALAL